MGHSDGSIAGAPRLSLYACRTCLLVRTRLRALASGYIAPPSDDGIQWYTPVIVLVLFCLSGLFSGLNLGLMSLDVVGLEIVEGSGSGKEPAFARVGGCSMKQWLNA